MVAISWSAINVSCPVSHPWATHCSISSACCVSVLRGCDIRVLLVVYEKDSGQRRAVSLHHTRSCRGRTALKEMRMIRRSGAFLLLTLLVGLSHVPRAIAEGNPGGNYSMLPRAVATVIALEPRGLATIQATAIASPRPSRSSSAN